LRVFTILTFKWVTISLEIKIQQSSKLKQRYRWTLNNHRLSSLSCATVDSGEKGVIPLRHRSPLFPILSGCLFGSGGYGEWGVRWPLYIFLSSLVDLVLVSLLVLFFVGGFCCFDRIVGGVVFSGVWSRFSSRASVLGVGAGRLTLQGFSGVDDNIVIAVAVLVRYVLLLHAWLGLEFRILCFWSSSSVDWSWPWRQLLSDTHGVAVAESGLLAHAFIVVRHGLWLTVLLLAFFKVDGASPGWVSAFSFLLCSLLCWWRWRRGEQRRTRSTELAIFGSSIEEVQCNLLLVWGLLCRGLDVILLCIQ
jgi:hypothetical protein